MTDIVNAVIARNGHILLVKRSPDRLNYPNTWSFAGGHVEPGETLAAALVREAQEELAITPTEFSFLTTLQDPNEPTVRYNFFQVTAWSGGEPELTGDEHSAMIWRTVEQAGGMDGLALPYYPRVLALLR